MYSCIYCTLYIGILLFLVKTHTHSSISYRMIVSYICVAVRQNYRNKYTKQNMNIKQPVRAPETCLIIHLFCDLAELLCRSTVSNLHLHVSFWKFVELVEGANCMGISLEQRLCQIKCIQLSIVTTIHYHP